MTNAGAVDLGDLEKGLEAAAFLAAMASVNLIIWSVALPIVVIVGGNGPQFPILLAYFGGIFVFFFLWSWAIAQRWRAPILLGAVIVGGGLAVVPIGELLRLKADIDWMVRAVFIAGALVAVGFALRIVVDGWRLWRTSAATRLLLAAPSDVRVSVWRAFMRALGIHPICRWLPDPTRRVAATLLFALTNLALAGALLFAIYVVMKVIPTELPATVDTCIMRVMGKEVSSPLGCTGAIIGTVLAPLFLVGPCLAAVAGLRLLARRTARVSLEAVSQRDTRPAILFLRSFKDDQIELALPRRPFAQRLMSIGEPRPRLDHVLLEEATPIGPVVAIGLPGSPPPFGAARAYFNDDEWRSAVAALARTARAIVIVIDDTEGVQWELSHIREAGLAAKTLYLLPPRLAKAPETMSFLRRVLAQSSPSSDPAALAAGRAQPAACIGWYQSGSGALQMLTTTAVSSTSYVGALRSAFGGARDHRLAAFSVAERKAELAASKIRRSLVEGLVVLGMLAPIAMMVATRMVQSLGSARAAFARAQMRDLSSALERYRFGVGDYPPQDVGLRALLQAPPGARGWIGPYISGERALLDPWGRPYIYRMPGATEPYDIVSLGRDGQPGGSGEDADITNWDKN